MESIIQLLVPLIIVILSVVLGNSRRRRTQQNVERRAEENTLAEADGEAAPPPFMEDFPFATDFEDMMTQQDEDETETVSEIPEESEPPAPKERTEPVRETSRPQPPPVPVESPARIRSIPATSLLNFSPQAFRQGIVLKEILERPRSRRNRGNRRK